MAYAMAVSKATSEYASSDIGSSVRRPRASAQFLRPPAAMAEDVLRQWLRAMRRGDFERAWSLSDRVRAARGNRPTHHLPRHEQSIWDGTPLARNRVLVRCYHGLGDTIQFARYLPLLKPSVRQLIVWAQPALLDLLRTMPSIDLLLPLHDGAPEADYDVDVEIMELPYIFRTIQETIPREIPYLDVPAAPLPKDSRLRVGVAWRAGDWNEHRSLDSAELEPLLSRSDLAIHSLQRDLRPAERRAPIMLDPLRLTVYGTAQLMRSLDLVISIDSMPAHLAGALGVPTWTLLPHEADWRWMEERDDSPWYPTMRLFRQERPGDWSAVIRRFARELDGIARASRLGQAV
jgi:hypothetical protein